MHTVSQSWFRSVVVETIGELQRGFRLYAVCARCRRMEPLPLDRLIAKLGVNAPISLVRARVRCQRCGRRTLDIRIVFTGQCDRAAGFHYRGNKA